jgi:hypothetical protein
VHFITSHEDVYFAQLAFTTNSGSVNCFCQAERFVLCDSDQGLTQPQTDHVLMVVSERNVTFECCWMAKKQFTELIVS